MNFETALMDEKQKKRIIKEATRITQQRAYEESVLQAFQELQDRGLL